MRITRLTLTVETDDGRAVAVAHRPTDEPDLRSPATHRDLLLPMLAALDAKLKDGR